jgi:hypothetical protein
MERGARQQALTQAAPAAFDTAKNAMSMLRGGGPVAAVDQQALQGAAGQFGAPAASFDVGGKTFDITQTPLQRSMMLAEQEAQRTKQTEAEKRSTLKAEQDTERKRLTTITALARSGNKAAKDELLATNPQAYEKLFPSRAPRQPNVVFDAKTGQIVNLDTGKATKAEGYQVSEEATHIPSTARTKMAEYDSSIKLLDDAITTADENQGAFGLQTMAPDFLVGRTGGQNKDAYNKARANVAKAIMKIRRTNFGVAVSKIEKETGVSLFPQDGDSYKQLAVKLDALKEMAQTELHSMQDEYGVSSKPKQPSGIQEW